MYILFLIFFFWFMIFNNSKPETFVVFIIFAPLIFFLYKKLKIESAYRFDILVVLSFFVSAVVSLPVAISLIIPSVKRNIYRGIYELEVGEMSEWDLFFMSCSITIVPNTIYIVRSGKSVFVHKIASDQKKAHEKDKLIFPKKKIIAE